MQNPVLMFLKHTLDIGKKIISGMNKEEITSVQPGDTVYSDLRMYNCDWYENLGLPDYEFILYVVKIKYLDWENPMTKKRIAIRCDMLEDEWIGRGSTVGNAWVRQFGSVRVFDPGKMTLIDENFLIAYPQIIEDSKRERILKRCHDALREN
jgi:hypothetical protein